jgi:hypothetical protein
VDLVVYELVNSCDGAMFYGPGEHSAESRQRMSETRAGVPKSAAHRQEIGVGRHGKRRTTQIERTCRACSELGPHGQRKLPSGKLAVLPRCQREFESARRTA